MKSRSKSEHGASKTPADAWRELIQTELKQNSKIGKVFEKAGFAGLENKVLTIYTMPGYRF